MFGNVRIKAAKSSKKLPSSSRYSFFRAIKDKCYRDPYNWGLIKCTAYFAASIFVARVLCDLNILPVEPPEPRLNPKNLQMGREFAKYNNS